MLRQAAAETVDERIDIGGVLRCFMPRLHNGVGSLPCSTLTEPCRVCKPLSLRCSKQSLHKGCGIGANGQIKTQNWFREFQRVDIDHSDIRRACPRRCVPADLIDAHARTDAEEEIAVLHGKIPRAVAHIAAASAVMRVIGCDEVNAVPAGNNGNIQGSIQAPEEFHAARPPNAVAGIENGTLRLSQTCEHLPCSLRDIRLRRCRWRHIACERIRFNERSLHIEGNIEPRGSRAPFSCKVKRLLELIADALRLHHHHSILRHILLHGGHDVNLLPADGANLPAAAMN